MQVTFYPKLLGLLRGGISHIIRIPHFWPGCIPCWSHAGHFYHYSVITPQPGWLNKKFIDPRDFLSLIRQEARFFLCTPRHFSKPTPDIFGPTYDGMHPGFFTTSQNSCSQILRYHNLAIFQNLYPILSKCWDKSGVTRRVSSSK